MLAMLFQTFELLVFHVLITVADFVSRLPRGSTPPELMRLHRENLALKAQNGALLLELDAARGKRAPLPLRVRAAQVFAYLLTRGNPEFQDYYLGASMQTIRRWLVRFRRGPWPWRRRPGGRPPLDEAIVKLIINLKQGSPAWGARRIQEELRRMGIRVSQPTIQKVLREHGYHPRGHSRSWEKFKSFACDALWAMDYLSVRTIRGTWLHVLLVIDLYSRELMELRVFDGWEADSAWTVTALADAMAREGRRPRAVLHDHGPHFLGQFERQLRVLEIDDRLAPAKLAFVNGCAERAIKSVRMELLNHVRVAGAVELQWYLDEYRSYYRTERAHQAIGGQTPDAFGRGEEIGDLVPVEWLRRRRLVQRHRAHGLLNSYVLAEAGGDDGIRAAA